MQELAMLFVLRSQTNMQSPDVSAIKAYLLSLQSTICDAIKQEDGQGFFQEDVWERPGGGGGRTHIFQQGAVIERGGVNFSHICGDVLPASASVRHPDVKGRQFEALGVSVVLHPFNPYAPTVHLNVRFFCATKHDATPVWWFGGGFDLTPYYGFIEDCQHWHQVAKKACEPLGEQRYFQYKKACDDYFYLPHRKEPRGIGGLFFDDLYEEGFDTCFAFLRSIGSHFIEAYCPILARRKNTPYTDAERAFQCYRRGRYVEFNLLYDRGTLFGLQSLGRIESILMSLPPEVSWRYDWHPTPGTEEAKLYDFFMVPRNWLDQ